MNGAGSFSKVPGIGILAISFLAALAAAPMPSKADTPNAGPAPQVEGAKANIDVAGKGVRGPDGRTRVIVLGPDDAPAFPLPPDGFDQRREGIPHGHTEKVEYNSTTVGTRRKLLVYTPPDYSSARRYPVLYLLHGIGGDETEWQRYAPPEVILDNLLSEGKVTPMIVVMPNGRARADDSAKGDIFSAENIAAFGYFEGDLLHDIIPSVESRYSVAADREHRALAGLSMGAGQSLNFGLAHLETFAWVGAFSPAPNTRSPAELVPHPDAGVKQLKLLWLSCGDHDGLIGIAQGVHRYLKAKGVPHVWQVDDHAHDTPEWRASLYHFSQLVFR